MLSIAWPEGASECDVRTLAKFRREKPVVHASPASLIAASKQVRARAPSLS